MRGTVRERKAERVLSRDSSMSESVALAWWQRYNEGGPTVRCARPLVWS